MQDYGDNNELVKQMSDQLQKLWDNGRKAWADVPNASDWVEEIRGNKMSEQQSDTRQKPNRKFRSSVSGIWHESPHDATPCDAVELFGERIYREPNEGSTQFILRVYEWATDIFVSKESKP